MNNSIDNQSIGDAAITTATTALAAASKTPFKTAFSITMGIGLGRLVLFFLGINGLIATVALAIKLFS